MKRLLGIASLALLLGTGCGVPPVEEAALASSAEPCFTPFVQPPGTVAVNFRADDRANRVYGPGDLKWRGSFLFDPATRVLVFDGTWSGALPGAEPYSGQPTLYDDGPWTRGGHEPRGARAGDHVWGVTAFVAPPAEGELAFQYGIIDLTYQLAYGDGWMWMGPNGAFAVPAGATGELDAPGITFERFGRHDLRFAIDVDELTQFEGWTWDTSYVAVKTSWWGWALAPMEAEGDGVYALELGDLLDAGLLPHTGLLARGAVAEFVFVLGPDEYKAWYTDGTSWWAEALTGGVTASTRCPRAHAWAAQPIGLADDGNTFVVAPGDCGRHGGCDGR